MTKTDCKETGRLIEGLRTYWSDDYNGPPMASDELGRKAADALEAKDKRIAVLEGALREIVASEYDGPKDYQLWATAICKFAQQALGEKE